MGAVPGDRPAGRDELAGVAVGAGVVERDRDVGETEALEEVADLDGASHRLVGDEMGFRGVEDRAPRLFLRYLQRLVKNRRQMLIPQIANEYRDLVDEVEGRVHAQVTLASPVGEEQKATIARHLTHTFGSTVVPQVRINPNILGGIIVRVGDRVMDGSVRKRLGILRARMLARTARPN